MAERWRFKHYRTVDGRQPYRDWYVTQPKEFKAACDVTIRILRVTETWTVKAGAKDLERDVPLTELMIDIDVKAPGAPRLSKRRFRPVGVKLSGEFVLFGGAEKRRGVYEPPEAFQRALKHWQDFQSGLGVADDYDL